MHIDLYDSLPTNVLITMYYPQAFVKRLRKSVPLNVFVLAAITIAQTLFYFGVLLWRLQPFSYTAVFQPVTGLFLFIGLFLFTCQNQIQLKSLGGGIAVVILTIGSSVASGVLNTLLTYGYFAETLSSGSYWGYVVSVDSDVHGGGP